MRTLKSPPARLLAYMLCVSLGWPTPGRAFNENLTDIAASPVTQPASTSMKPNILLILDDSGSMARQFTPDYVSTYTTPTGTVVTTNCFDSFDTGTASGSANTINNTLDECWAGDPPAMSPDFNVQYYNPEIRYRPAVDYTGIERNSMTSANTTAWTSVLTDNVSTAASDYARKDLTGSQGGPSSPTGNWGNDASPTIDNLNLTTLWPDRVWCTDPADSATDTVRCKTNSSYSYPNGVHAYGLDSSGDRKYKFGAPYYYRIVVKEYCSDARMNDCLPLCEGAATPPACIISATSPDNVVGGKSYSVAAPVRFCTDSTLTDCHAKRSTSRLYPKFVGKVATAISVVAPVPATATIYLGVASGSPPVYGPQPDQKTAGAASSAQGTISSITVKKTAAGCANPTAISIAGASFNLTAGQSNSQWADTIETRIDGQTGTTGFSATSPGSTVVISAPASTDSNLLDANGFGHNPECFNGAEVTIGTTATSHVNASYVLTFDGLTQNSACTGSPLSCANVSSISVDGVEFIPVGSSPVKCNHTDCNNATASTRRNRMATLVNAAIVLPTGWTKDAPGAGGLASNQIRLKAPTAGAVPLGSAMNGKAVTVTRLQMTSPPSSGQVMSGGSTTGDVSYNVTTFSGGQNETTTGALVRTNVGTFQRVNILPGQTYNLYSERTDCVAQANVCTYAEEMTNFANWFAYYRTRIQTAKTAIGRAFALAGIGDNFRVGFVTINFSSSRYLAVAPFTTGAGNQKDLWFQELYGSIASSSTPLIGALVRAGRYFGDKFNGVASSMGASPINSACQPNYAILTSDGYWNDGGTAAKQLDGTTSIGDADGDGKSNTLADVAHWYYSNDLRPFPVAPATTPIGYKDQVPPSGDDTAPHQHMTTFTVGMGVSGSLLFHPNYATSGNSIDYDAISATGSVTGSSLWPTPTANTETTIDDMWHAAVNGRGRFFSAQNPVALAAGINEVLSSVQKRVGAGAAAATSNLQPVAGDNFAFTAQYQTVEWSGDLKARTISLTDGVIGERELWSAQEQLDLRTFSDRKIFTFDENDTDNTQLVTVDGSSRTQNANRLRSFCRTDAPLSTYPTCTDGGLITSAETAEHFDPLGGPNGALGQTGGWPGGDARRNNAAASNNTYIFRYLRGERAKEISLGGTSGNDMFRARAHLLGDIVNAQPAYVKSTPFSYSAATDPYYTAFQNSTNGGTATRKGTVYVAANDGMLHAFETDPDNSPYYQDAGVSSIGNLGDDHFTGTLNTDPLVGEGAERWAYVPNLVFSTMKRLAEENYPTNHRFFTDGSPQIGDVCFGHTTSVPCANQASWRTILVAGLNAGGRGFYALDVTDPDNPKGLWELRGGSQALVSGSVKCLTNAEANSGTFSVDCNLGYSFGNPIIAKRPQDGKWVVLVTSGYNNVNPGSGLGYLYVIDAQTGKILRRMSTGVGCAQTNDPDGACASNIDDPSGLARINAWVDSATTNNTALAVYGGDLKGNLWRFQLDDTAAVPRHSVTRLGTVEADTHVAQPITAKPELALVKSNRVVYIGTGKFLGDTDKASLQKQSIYAIKDTMTGVTNPQVNMVRTGTGAITGFVRQALTENTTTTRTVTSPAAVNLTSDKGWFIDLPDGGTGEEAAERVSVDPIIQLGTLVVPSNVPSTETCLAGGSGWVNFLDITTGALVPALSGSTNPASQKIAGSLIVGINIVKIGDQIKTIVTTADNQQLTKETPVAAQGVQGRRVTWRELIVE